MKESQKQKLIVSDAVVRLIQGKRLEVQGPGRLVIYMGSSHSGRRDAYWYEHPGGRTYKEEPEEVVRAVLPHVGYEAIERAHVFNSAGELETRGQRDIHSKPLADRGLTSYRLKGPYGWIMIGAHDHDDAMREAARSTSRPLRKNLEVWRNGKYLPAYPRSRK